jgi:hypothetical protein
MDSFTFYKSCKFETVLIYLPIYGPTSLVDLGRFSVGRTPWTGDQAIARPLSTQRTIQTQNKCIKISNGIRTHDPSVRAGDDLSCLRPSGHCEGQNFINTNSKFLLLFLFVFHSIMYCASTMKHRKYFVDTLNENFLSLYESCSNKTQPWRC